MPEPIIDPATSVVESRRLSSRTSSGVSALRSSVRCVMLARAAGAVYSLFSRRLDPIAGPASSCYLRLDTHFSRPSTPALRGASASPGRLLETRMRQRIEDASPISRLLLLALVAEGATFGVASAAVPVGLQFQVNSYTNLEQRRPAAAMEANGDFVVVWQSTRDGVSYDVIG